MGFTVLYKVPNQDLFKLPGINLANLGSYLKPGADKKNKSSLLQNGRFVTVEIPGVIYLQRAMIESIRPTVSKETTASRFPLWMNLEIIFESLFPANTQMIDDIVGSQIGPQQLPAAGAK
jgi:hypothetical protein